LWNVSHKSDAAVNSQYQSLPWTSQLFDELHAGAFDKALRLDGHRIEHARGDTGLMAEDGLCDFASLPWAAMPG
jgi:hypothetical protein